MQENLNQNLIRPVIPNEDKVKIIKKTEELFNKRIALYLPDLEEEKKQLILQFQELIFELDYYGEHNQKIEPKILELFWKEADNFLEKLSIPENVRTELIQDVKDYAEIEISTRAGYKLSDYDIKDFYFKKSCDVRMQRHLLRFLLNQEPKSKEDEIRKDIFEEIEDDIDDIEEDKATPLNGNRLLKIMNDNDKSKLNQYLIFLENTDLADKETKNRILQKLKMLKL